MNQSEMRDVIRRVEAASNKTALLAQFGIKKATYYLWRRRFLARGDRGLQTAKHPWSESDDRRLRAAVGSCHTIDEITRQFPGRSYRAVAARITHLGLSFRESLRSRSRELATKECRRCHAELPVSEFYLAKGGAIDGRHVYCKRCLGVAQADYRGRNLESVRQRQRKYRDQRRETHPGYHSELVRVWRQTARGSYSTLKRRLRQRNLMDRLVVSFAEFERWYEAQEKRCAYCGLSLDEYLALRGRLSGLARRATRLSIDRKDSSGGYTTENMTLACLHCNLLKGFIFSHEDFIQICERFILPKIMKAGQSR